MTRPHNYGWRHVGQPTADTQTRLAQVNASIADLCRYQKQCLDYADNAARLIERLKDEQFALVEALKALEAADKTGI